MTTMEMLWTRIRICKERGGDRCTRHCPLYSFSADGVSCRPEVLRRPGEAEKLMAHYIGKDLRRDN